MREFFPEFNKPTKAEFQKIWDEAVFIFDANILLSLYRLPEKSRNDFIATLEKLEIRIWIPHQVAKEYYKNKHAVIAEQLKAYKNIISILKSSEDSLKKQLDEHSRHSFIDCAEIKKHISSNFEQLHKKMTEAMTKHPNWHNEDTVEASLDKIFKDKIGKPFDKDELNKIYADGEARYQKEIPPGYKDSNKDNKDKTGTLKFGDLIIWFQIINKAKQEKKPIVFITDDKKEDWWWRVGEKTIGARHELVREIKDHSDASFCMYQLDEFMEFANEYLSTKIGQDVINDVKRLKEISHSTEALVKSISETLAGTSSLANLSTLADFWKTPPGFTEAVEAISRNAAGFTTLTENFTVDPSISAAIEKLSSHTSPFQLPGVVPPNPETDEDKQKK